MKGVEGNEKSEPAAEAAKRELSRRRKKQEKIASLKRLEIHTGNKKSAPSPAPTVEAAKPELSRRKKREAVMRRHFSRQEEQPTVVQEEPSPVSPRLALDDVSLRSSSTGRMTPLRRRTEVVPAALARRREELVMRLYEKRRAEPVPVVLVAATGPLKDEQDGTSTEPHKSKIRNLVPDQGRSKGRLGRWNETKHKRSSSANAARTPTNEKEDAKGSSAFDLRSVVDDPPDPIRIGAARVALAVDPSWDTSRVYFSEFDISSFDPRRFDRINMFDAASWVGTDVSFSNALGPRGPMQADPRPEVNFADEKKEKDPANAQPARQTGLLLPMMNADTLDPPGWPVNFADEKKEKYPANVQPVRQTGILPMHDDVLDPLGWPVQQDGLLNVMTDAIFDEKKTSTFEGTEDDAENLLVGSSAANLDDSYHREGMLPKEERINLYSTSTHDDMSETEDTDGEEDIEDDEVGYVSQSDEEEDMGGGSSQNGIVDSVRSGMMTADFFASFDAAASSATASAKPLDTLSGVAPPLPLPGTSENESNLSRNGIVDSVKGGIVTANFFATFDVADSSAAEAAKPLDTPSEVAPPLPLPVTAENESNWSHVGIVDSVKGGTMTSDFFATFDVADSSTAAKPLDTPSEVAPPLPLPVTVNSVKGEITTSDFFATFDVAASSVTEAAKLLHTLSEVSPPLPLPGTAENESKLSHNGIVDSVIGGSLGEVSPPLPLPVTTENESKLSQKSSQKSESALPLPSIGNMSAVPPPPPPPPPGSKKKRVVPLLSPPPAEKLKKWEESKLKPLKHLRASKDANSGLPPLHFKIKEKEVEEKVEVVSEMQLVEDFASFVIEKETASANGGGIEALAPGSPQRNHVSEKLSVLSYDKALSPASSAAIIHDAKMAEKVDIAISAAAMKFEEHVAQTPPQQDAALDPPDLSSLFQGGAFSAFTWETADLADSDIQGCAEEGAIRRPADASSDVIEAGPESQMLQNTGPSEADMVAWLLFDVLRDDRLSASLSQMEAESREESVAQLRFLLEDDKRFNVVCRFIFDGVTDSRVEPFSLPKRPDPADVRSLAFNFVKFLRQVSEVTNVVSPFGDENPFLDASGQCREPELGRASGKVDSVQGFVFDHRSGAPDLIVGFAFRVHQYLVGQNPNASRESSHKEESRSASVTTAGRQRKKAARTVDRRLIVPDEHPSPFEAAIRQQVKIVSLVLGFLGDPVVVCRMKMVNKACYRYIDEHEQQIMQDAVRLGGLSANSRPAFWMWVTLQKANQEQTGPSGQRADHHGMRLNDLTTLERQGRAGKWNHVIERDVTRAFGNLPPHKTGARLRTDSIVRALVTWGKSRIMKRGVKGSGDPPPASRTGSHDDDSDDVSLTPTETVSDWGGVSPTGSFAASSFSGANENSRANRQNHGKEVVDELALGGNAMTDDMKRLLQDKLSCILNALAAVHEDVGYCQGMDYVVAHLLRILQETIRFQAARGQLPSVIKSAPQLFYGKNLGEQEMAEVYAEIDRSLVVEETCFRVMDTFLSTYSLRHFYWPELRCLKTCCLVFEKLIKIKLPVLADHFEHHELNVGLFALGWFQTLFLYLPSMPSATVCHMWDIWLVERSFKIFFRVGTAILFLSQPILLNHELEGMMTYLNTFPDATLLNPDILIACALQIKVTNRMLMELEHDIRLGTM
jgi:hypothetical protein